MRSVAVKSTTAVFVSGTLLLAGVSADSALAQQTASQAGAPKSIKLTDTYQLTGTITAIDPVAREVHVTDAQGQTFVFAVGPGAKNFNQLKTNDHVRLKLTRAVAVSVSPGNGIRSSTETVTAASAPLGQMPSGSVQHRATIVADVIGVDRKHGLLKVKGPQGNVIEARVRHPELLGNVKEGDQLTLDYTEAVALSVTRAP
jgi:hypothetical protein